MPGFLLDECVAIAVAPILRRHGHQATTIRDLGLRGITDTKMLNTARELGYITVTHNAHQFAGCHREWSKLGPAAGHAGILIIPAKYALAPDAAADHLVEFMSDDPVIAYRFFQLERDSRDPSVYTWVEKH